MEAVSVKKGECSVAGSPDLVCAYRLLNVLYLLNTKVREGHRQDLAHLIVRRTGDTNATRFRQCLQPRRNVHAIAKQVPGADHHVTDVHANAEVDAAVRRETGVRFGQGGLRIHRALHRIHGASKLGKDTIARRVRYAAPMLPNEPIEDRPALGEPLERADLIGTHEPAVALHVCCEDCNQLPADVRKV